MTANLQLAALFTVAMTLIVGIWYGIYTDQQNTFELKKACTEQHGTFAEGLCLFGAKP